MTHKETDARVASSINISSKRFLDNLLKTSEMFKFCMTISKSSRVTGAMIRRLAAMGIEE